MCGVKKEAIKCIIMLNYWKCSGLNVSLKGKKERDHNN